MKTNFRLVLGTAAAISAFAVTAANAQNVFAGTDIAEERNEDLIEAIEDDAERDLDGFGNEGRPQGFTGSVALRGIAQSGNTDSADVGIGANFGYVQGPNGYELQLSYAYGEDDGTKNEESLFYGLEYTRDFNPTLFAFAKVQGSVDQFSDFESDTFVSFGAGYRIYNEPTIQWSVQAGPGYRVANITDIADDIDEFAIGISSDYAHKLSETVFVTNDTDIVSSDADTVVFNDLALSVSMTDALALRTSVLTEYHTDPAGDDKSTDNRFGVSLVYSFN